MLVCSLGYSFTVYFNRRERSGPSKKHRRKDSSDKLRKLDAVSPIRTLQEWWAKAHGPPLPSDVPDNQFIWYGTFLF